jgi:hypothetical protein
VLKLGPAGGGVAVEAEAQGGVVGVAAAVADFDAGAGSCPQVLQDAAALYW